MKKMISLLLAVAGAVVAELPEKPNVVFLLADDLAWDQLSCYGDEEVDVYGAPKVPTPNIDRIAERGVKFTHFTANAFCTPSRAAFLTGRYGWRTGQTANTMDIFGGPNPRMRSEEITLAEALGGEGYTTAFMGKAHLDWYNIKHPDLMNRVHGFDEVFMYAGQTGEDVPDRMQKIACVSGGMVYNHFADHFFHNGQPVPRGDGYSTDILTEQALRFLRQDFDKPFLLWMPFFAVHEAWQAPQEWIDRFPVTPELEQAREKAKEVWETRKSMGLVPPTAQLNFGLDALQIYRAKLACMDYHIGRILDYLEQTDDPRFPGRKLAETTIIIFSSDNGGHPFVCGGKGSMTDAGVRVPLIVSWPGHFQQGVTCDALSENVDLFPTLVAAGGGSLAEDRVYDGRNLIPLLMGKKPADWRAFGFSEIKNWIGLCDHDWFYSSWPGGNQERFFRRQEVPASDTLPVPVAQVPEEVKTFFRELAAKRFAERDEALAPYIEERKQWVDAEKQRREQIVHPPVYPADKRSPADVPGAALWLDAAGLSSTPSLTQWKDRTGYGRHAVAKSGFAPAVVGDATNGQSMVRFDGVGSAMIIDQYVADLNQADFDLFVVLKNRGGGCFLSKDNCDERWAGGESVFWLGNGRLAGNGGVPSRAVHGCGAVIAAEEVVPNGVSVIEFRRHILSEMARWGIDGVDRGWRENTLNTRYKDHARNVLTLGGRLAHAATPLDGDIGELILFPRDLNDTERRQILDYLKKKWSDH